MFIVPAAAAAAAVPKANVDCCVYSCCDMHK